MTTPGSIDGAQPSGKRSRQDGEIQDDDLSIHEGSRSPAKKRARQGPDANIAMSASKSSEKLSSTDFTGINDYADISDSELELCPAELKQYRARKSRLMHSFIRHYGCDWVWKAAFKAIQSRNHDREGCEAYGRTEGYVPTRYQLDLLENAVPGWSSHSERCKALPAYPRRPQKLLPSSELMDALREVLARIPKKPDGWACSMKAPKGLMVEYSEDPDSEVEQWYEWDGKTFQDVYHALTKVVQNLGVEAWKAARWEVYDKYAESIGSIEITGEKPEDLEWEDKAYPWLMGRIEHPGARWYDSRTHTTAGKEYNNAAPLLSIRE